MLQLRVFGASELIADVADQPDEIHGARHVIVSGNGAAGQALVTAWARVAGTSPPPPRVGVSVRSLPTGA